MQANALFRTININGLELRNRVVMGSMHIGLEALENGVEKLIEFYRLRAEHEVGLIVTGGVAINAEGSGGRNFMSIYQEGDVEKWKPLTAAVHKENGAIALQLFHAGRYAYKDQTGCDPVAPSPIKSPIHPDVPLELSHEDILRTIKEFAEGAKNAKEAGFDAVEIMGSEGYLINQFVSPVTNKRTDDWGGSFEKRIALSLEVSKAVRHAVGDDFPVFFRMSGLDLIKDSTTDEETIQWAKALEKADVDALNIGIGWHESQIPTISMKVPRMSFVSVAEKIKEHVSLPVVASNRINDPQEANTFLEKGTVDLVSMARPFLADPAILTKAKEKKFAEINTCIACNQACLDHVFSGLPASCLVNPEAGRELELPLEKTANKKHVLVIGAGPAGLEASRVAAKRGHQVTLVDRRAEIGGQLNYSKLVPGKQEFYETLRYYKVQLELLGVEVRLDYDLTEDDPLIDQVDEIIVATGILPRTPDISGIEESEAVVSYRDVFDGKVSTGENVVIIGGGGIAIDLALLLKEKGVESITLLQRGKSFGRGLGKTTRWATLMELQQKGIKSIGQIEEYKQIDGNTIVFKYEGEEKSLSADSIVIAAGQLVNQALATKLREKGKTIHVIGGAEQALGLDAKEAIYNGAVVARKI